MLRFTTAGESHGKGLTVIIEGIPAGLEITKEDINSELRRRKIGYGRGGRMDIEDDRVEIISGVRLGKTLGSPIALFIPNQDRENWSGMMRVEKGEVPSRVEVKKGGRVKYVPGQVSVPRPGHADLPGALKYNHDDLRNVLERSSARETAARVAAGAVAKKLLRSFNIEIISLVTQIGSSKLEEDALSLENILSGIGIVKEGLQNSPTPEILRSIKEYLDRRPLRCPDPAVEAEMIKEIDRVKEQGDTVGGVIEFISTPLPPGLGSYSQWDLRLDGKIAAALMSIPGIKGVEIGLGFRGAHIPGSRYHDQIYYSPERGFYYSTNHSGGVLGGMSSGQLLRARAVMKPIPTLMRPLSSVDLKTGERKDASVERSDTCAVPAAGVVGEAMLALVITGALKEKFGGDYLEEMQESFNRYLEKQKIKAGS